MRILLISHFPLKGSGSGFYTENIAKSLANLGHDVCVIMPENDTEIEQIDGVIIQPVFFKKDKDINNVLPFNFPCFTTHPRSSTTFNELSEQQLEKYINAFQKNIEYTIEKFKPDIIHSQHIWILSSIASKYSIPTIITSHETDIIGYNLWNRFHKYCEEAVEQCSKIITISKANNGNVIKNFPEAENKVVQIYNGYDQNIFYNTEYDKKEILEEFGINKEYKKIVLFSGKLVYIKGVDLLLKAAKRYEDEETLTIIAGDGILLEELKRQSEELNLNNIVFIGNQTQINLNKLYNIADVLAVPSRIEGFGLVAVEALACGTPVVATNCGGMTEFINESVGILVETEDDIGLAKEISRILNKEKVFNRMNLENYAKNNYSQRLLIDKVIKTYKSCL